MTTTFLHGFKITIVTALIFLLSACGGGDSTPASSPASSTPTDTTAPVITLLGSNPYTMVQGATYTDAGATASDNVDGDITANITTTGVVDTAVVGTYQIAYHVSDAAGNAATQVVRTVTVTAAPFVPRLNDTGITTWGNASVNNLTTTQALFPNQDADVGRDALAAAGTLIKTGGGKAGFDFTKLDASGQPLANQAATYATTPWSCVQDNVTGLMWEVKTPAGLGGLHDANHTYTWFNSDPYTNGGNAGTANGGVCADTLNCDTEKYVAAVNAAGLCGFSDWRLPKKGALRSIVDYSVALPGPTVDMSYFPNTLGSWYWSASPYSYAGFVVTDARDVDFNDGSDSVDLKSSNHYVRLVRGGL